MDYKIMTTQTHDDSQASLIQQLREENDKLKQDCSTMKSQLDLLQQENLTIRQEQTKSESLIQELQQQVSQIQQAFAQSLQDNDERHAILLGQFNELKDSIMQMLNNGTQDAQQLLSRINDATSVVMVPPVEPATTTTPIIEQQADQTITATATATATTTVRPIVEPPLVTSTTNSRSIPAPSKILVDDHKKKDNRLVELRRITRQHMQVDDEEAGLRLYKLQKTMVHVVSDLKKYMKERHEDVTKSWKSIDISTQRVAFEMVEKEAQQLGVPLHLCIGYWGARRLISKSWANALRTTKKNGGRGNSSSRIVATTTITDGDAATAVINATTTAVTPLINADIAGPETSSTIVEGGEEESQVIDHHPSQQPILVVGIGEATASLFVANNSNNIFAPTTEMEATTTQEQGTSDDHDNDTRQHKKLKLA